MVEHRAVVKLLAVNILRSHSEKTVAALTDEFYLGIFGSDLFIDLFRNYRSFPKVVFIKNAAYTAGCTGASR